MAEILLKVALKHQKSNQSNVLSSNPSHGELSDKVCQRLAAGQCFSPGTLVSSTNKTDRHDIAETPVFMEVIIIFFFSQLH